MRKKLDNISHGKPSAEPSSLKASQLSNTANIRTDVEKTKQKLKVVADKYMGQNSVRGFLTDIWAALGIQKPTKEQQKGGTPSRYAAFKISDGSTITITIRASAHNADASNYTKKGNVNGDSNLSLVLQKRWKKNTFKSVENVKLDEFVYVESLMANVKNPLSQIANSLIGYMTNGQYVDTTGIAIEHHSPQINKESKSNKNMKRKRTITESQLRNIVAESVRNILSELDWKTLANAEKEARRRGNRSYWSDKGYEFPDAISKAARQRIRAERFGSAARDAFNRDYGYKTGDYWDNEGYKEVCLGGEFDATEEFAPHVVGRRSAGYGYPTKYEYGRRDDTFKPVKPEEFFENDPEAARAYHRAKKEWRDYKKGNYAYTKGKGWHLKDED